jgi:hypothetical protein
MVVKFQGLYKLGARKHAIINVGMLGCVPAARLFDATGACEAGLAATLPGLAYSLADFYGLMEATFANPEAVG